MHRAIFLLLLIGIASTSLAYNFKHSQQQKIAEAIESNELSRTTSPITTIKEDGEDLDIGGLDCQQIALAFYESCFQMSNDFLQKSQNKYFILGIWKACSELTIKNYNECFLKTME